MNINPGIASSTKPQTGGAKHVSGGVMIFPGGCPMSRMTAHGFRRHRTKDEKFKRPSGPLNTKKHTRGRVQMAQGMAEMRNDLYRGRLFD